MKNAEKIAIVALMCGLSISIDGMDPNQQNNQRRENNNLRTGNIVAPLDELENNEQDPSQNQNVNDTPTVRGNRGRGGSIRGGRGNTHTRRGGLVRQFLGDDSEGFPGIPSPDSPRGKRAMRQTMKFVNKAFSSAKEKYENSQKDSEKKAHQEESKKIRLDQKMVDLRNEKSYLNAKIESLQKDQQALEERKKDLQTSLENQNIKVRNAENEVKIQQAKELEARNKAEIRLTEVNEIYQKKLAEINADYDTIVIKINEDKSRAKGSAKGKLTKAQKTSFFDREMDAARKRDELILLLNKSRDKFLKQALNEKSSIEEKIRKSNSGAKLEALYAEQKSVKNDLNEAISNFKRNQEQLDSLKRRAEDLDLKINETQRRKSDLENKSIAIETDNGAASIDENEPNGKESFKDTNIPAAAKAADVIEIRRAPSAVLNNEELGNLVRQTRKALITIYSPDGSDVQKSRNNIESLATLAESIINSGRVDQSHLRVLNCCVGLLRNKTVSMEALVVQVCGKLMAALGQIQSALDEGIPDSAVIELNLL